MGRVPTTSCRWAAQGGHAPIPKTTYKASVAYNVDHVTVRTNKGLNAEPTDDPMQISISPGDTKTAILGHQVYLNEPGKKTVIKITAKSKNSPTKGFTTYTLEVTRAKTLLMDLDICGNSDTCVSPGNNILLPPGTMTPALFDPATTTYTATTSYSTTKVAVVTAPDSDTDDRLVAITAPGEMATTTVNPLPVNLVVGDNEIGIDVGLKSSSIRPNTTTYSVNVMRMAPAPTLRLTLLDKDGNLLGTASHEFELDAQSKTYNFVGRTSDTFSENDFLLLNSIRIATNALDDGVRVSVNDGVTVRPLGATNELTLPGLTGSVINLEFEVRYRTGDDNNEDASTHIIVIRRPADTRPTFPANDPLRDREIVLLVGERFSPDGINAPVELPFAHGRKWRPDIHAGRRRGQGYASNSGEH